ncbi:MAG: lipid A export permease/ATP-binding protein MsbA [Betaproteobacteria bacterium]|nr:lipid A export permease/ATP-binding protein MsbA [Betaproteobacteria bacterium]NBY07158.1 lipid A export permease/ATP-binding protein MsbA [Betaproteobacteria bacterium]
MPSSHSKTLIQRLLRAARFFNTPTIAWLAVVVSVIIVSISEPMIPALLKPLLDRGFVQGKIELWLVPVSLIGLFAVRGLCVFTSQVAMAKISNQGLLKLRTQMFEKLLHAHPDLYRQQSASALGNTLVYEVQTGASMMVQSLLSMARDTLTLLALVGYLLYLNWKLSLIVALLFPSVAWLIKALSKRLFVLSKNNQHATDELAYVVEENALAYREIRLYGGQNSQKKRFVILGNMLQRLAMKTIVASSAITPLTQLCAAIALSGVICVALLQSSYEGTTVGGFTAYVTAMLMLIAPIKHLSDVTTPLTRGLVAVERALELIESTPSETSGTFTKDRASGHISLENIRVQYNVDSQPALFIEQLQINPGETLALVGPSGAGKTSLVNLLPRFIDPSAGHVSLDGVSIADWKLASLRSQFAMVSQNVIVLNDTLANNVALGHVLDREHALACLHAANLQSYVDQLALGIDTLVGHNASQLSGGQRQRLAIARALYKDAPILILDEATSALDNESERAVQEALHRLKSGRTTIIIAHRLSTIEHADRIVVMQEGQIIEIGKHADLMQAQGTYASLFKLGSFYQSKS